MSKIVPNDLLKPTEKTIKNWNCSFIAVEGPNIADKLSLEDLEIPYESQYRSRIVLKAGDTDQPLIYGFIGKAVTFLMIKVTYDSVNDPYYQYEQQNYNINYYFENDHTLRPLNRLMILTGSIDDRIPQIYLNNPLDYDVVLDVLHATIDSEYENTGTTVYHQHLKITNVYQEYSGSTSDEYIRCSGSTESGSTYTIFLPYSTGTGNVLTIKNIDHGVISVSTKDFDTIDYSLLPLSLSGITVLRLIDADNGNWDII
jgi:hypothetical protein